MTESAPAPRGGSVSLRVGRNHEALVDEADLHLIEGVKWKFVTRRGLTYAIADIGGEWVLMHRLLTGAPRGKVVDHINGNGLDNRRANLRVCEHRENIRNQKVRSGPAKTTKFKGVSLTKSGRYSASIEQNDVRLHLGTFPTPEKAAKVYDAAARVFFGKFARTNAAQGLL